MKSHEYAAELQKSIDHILSKPDVDFDSEPHIFLHFYNKEKFVAVAKGMGSIHKEFSSDELVCKVDGTCIEIRAPRNLVCRKIQEAKFVCEPLLTDRELQALGEKLLEDEVF